MNFVDFYISGYTHQLSNLFEYPFDYTFRWDDKLHAESFKSSVSLKLTEIQGCESCDTI